LKESYTTIIMNYK